MVIGATGRGLCFVQFADSDEDLFRMLRAEYPAAALEQMRKPYPKEFHRWMTSLENHLQGKEPHLDLPLDLRATAFQMKVWRYLQSIPSGSVQSYSEVAAGNRPSLRRQSRSSRLREQPCRGGDPLPSRNQQIRQPRRVSLGC